MEREGDALGRKLNNMTEAQKKDRSGNPADLEIDVARSNAQGYLRAIGKANACAQRNEKESSERAEYEARLLILESELDELRK